MSLTRGFGEREIELPPAPDLCQSFLIMLTRPDSTEHAEFYKNYIARVPDGPLLNFLAKQPGDYRQLLVGQSDEDASAPTAPGKWSIKQVLGHLCDTERVITYRVLRFARGDQKELEGFEQDDYVREARPIRAVSTICWLSLKASAKPALRCWVRCRRLRTPEPAWPTVIESPCAPWLTSWPAMRSIITKC